MTRELIQAMLDGKTLNSQNGDEAEAQYLPGERIGSPFVFRYVRGDRKGIWHGLHIDNAWDKNWTIKPEPRRRPMTRWEMRAWACSEQAHGWVVRSGGGAWFAPQVFDIVSRTRRSRIFGSWSVSSHQKRRRIRRPVGTHRSAMAQARAMAQVPPSTTTGAIGRPRLPVAGGESTLVVLVNELGGSNETRYYYW